MATFVATIQVPAEQRVWRAEDVPVLTANALHHFEPEPDPPTAKTELRRFTSADLQSRSAGYPLHAKELAQFTRKCRAAGMPKPPEALPYSRWGEYLEVFNQDAESRGWWAGLIPPRDLHVAERLSWVVTVEAHRKLLQEALRTGEIQARMGVTLVPAEPGSVALHRVVLTRHDLERFAGKVAMQVVDAPVSNKAGPVDAGGSEVRPSMREYQADLQAIGTRADSKPARSAKSMGRAPLAPSAAVPEGIAVPLEAGDIHPQTRHAKGSRWTDAKLMALAEVRRSEGTKIAGESFGISEQRVRALLPGGSTERTANAPFGPTRKR